MIGLVTDDVEVLAAVEQFADYIQAETLAVGIELGPLAGVEPQTRQDRPGRACRALSSKWSARERQAASFRFEPRSPLRLAVLISGGGTTLENLIDKIAGRRSSTRRSSWSSPAIRPRRGLQFAAPGRAFRTAVIERRAFADEAAYQPGRVRRVPRGQRRSGRDGRIS